MGSEAQPAGRIEPYTPKHPALMAWGLLTVGIIILSWPMWTGLFLGGPASDQFHTGHTWRWWAAQQIRLTGHVPLWNPWVMGGVPFVAASAGDIFYPTALLRLLLPTTIAMNLGFVIHYVLAGGFAYTLARKFGIGWTGSVVAGFSYQLSGLIGSYVHPGHDGKLFVTAMLPLAFIALIMGIRERRLEGFGVFALAVGLALLSPHYQMTQYFLLACGLFTLYLAFEGNGSRATTSERLRGIGLAAAAVVLGFGISMIQVLPFFSYIPFSPRAEGITRGFEWSTTYAIPWQHVPEFFLSGFAGDYAGRASYWGPNGIKFHSEYLGMSVIALAVLGVASPGRRKMAIWLGSIGLLFLLVALGDSTPFFKLWYSVVPYVAQTRAPGMALFVTILMLSLFAGMGVDRVWNGDGKLTPKIWVGIGAAVALLGLAGAFGAAAENLALELGTVENARRAGDQIRSGALLGGGVLAALGGLILLVRRSPRALPPLVVSIGAIGLIGSEMYANARPFWLFSDIDEEFYAADPIIERLRDDDSFFRVYNLSDTQLEVYRGASLMRHGIRQILGGHGNELRYFDDLMGGQGSWQNLSSSDVIWDLYNIKYIILPSAAGPSEIPGYAKIMESVPIADGASRYPAGTTANLFERVRPSPYARVVREAVVLDYDAIPRTVAGSNFPADRVVLVDSTSGIAPAELTAIPEASGVDAVLSDWSPGAIEVSLEWNGNDPERTYLVLSENYFPDWRAIDSASGAELKVVRGNGSLLTVEVSRGTERVELEYVSGESRLGKVMTLISLTLCVVAIGLPPLRRRKVQA